MVMGMFVVAQADLLVYEGFDYSSDDMTTWTDGIGFDLSSWYVDGSFNTLYLTNSVEFGTLSTSGNAVFTKESDGSSSTVRVTSSIRRGISASTSDGDLYLAYVTAKLSGQRQDGVGLGIGGNFKAEVTQPKFAQGRLTYNGISANATNFASADNETYLTIAKFSDLGTAGAGATMWVLTEAGYDAIDEKIADGSVTDADLTANCFDTIGVTATTGGVLSSSDTLYWMNANAGTSDTDVVMDELRVGTTIGDVIPTTLVDPAAAAYGTAVIVPDDSGSAFLNSGSYVLGMNVASDSVFTSVVNGVQFISGGISGKTQSLTKNGVTVSVTVNTNGFSSDGFSSGIYTDTASLDEPADVLDSGFVSSFGDAGFFTIEISGLTSGQTYRVQTFHLINTGDEGSRDIVYEDGSSVSDPFSVSYDASGSNISAAVANTVIFTASGSSKIFSVLPESNDRAYLNGLSLYSIEGVAYSSWIDQYPELGSLSDMTDDPDGDGLSNLAEWALGGDPTDADDHGLASVVELSDGYFQYVYPQQSDAAAFGLFYCLEQTDSLVLTWTNGNYEITGTNVTGGAFDYVTNRVPLDAASAQFLKLVIESN
jgi:hypothetical protein